MPPAGQSSAFARTYRMVLDLAPSWHMCFIASDSGEFVIWDSECKMMCVFICADPGINRRGEVCGTNGLCQTAVQTVWHQRNLQRHRSDSHERYFFTLIEPEPEQTAQPAVNFDVKDKIMRTVGGKLKLFKVPG